MAVTTLAGCIWAKLEFDLAEVRDLFQMRLESREEAIGYQISPANPKTSKKAKWADTAPRWEDDELGAPVRAWHLIPYIDAIDQETLQERLDAGKRLVGSIEKRLAARELTPELLYEWGLLNRWAGALQLVYFSQPSIGHRRSALAGGKSRIDDAEAHQRWFAHYFMRRYKRGHRKEAERAFERLVNAIIDETVEVPAEWDVTWFEAYMMEPKYTELKPAFNEHSLSVERMKALAAMGTEGIPPVDLEFPDP